MYDPLIFERHKLSAYTQSHEYIIAKQYKKLYLQRVYKVFSSLDDFTNLQGCNPVKTSFVGTPTDILKIEKTFLLINDKYMKIKRRVGNSETRYTFCNVYSKKLFGYHVRRFVFEFFPDPNDSTKLFGLVMFLSNNLTYADTYYKNTRLRFNGTTDQWSEVGLSTFRLVLLEPTDESLIDNIDMIKLVPQLKFSMPKLFCGWSKKTTPEKDFDKQIGDFKKFGFISRMTEKVFTIQKHSVFKIKEIPNTDNFDSLVFISMVLALKQQETERVAPEDPFHEIVT